MGRSINTFVSSTLAVVSAGMFLVSQPAQAEQAGAAAPEESTRPIGIPWYGQAPLVALPLDDPANPWAARYSEIDRQLREHVLPASEPWPTEQIPGFPGSERTVEGVRMVYLELDEHGWQLPFSETARRAQLMRQLADRRSGQAAMVADRLQLMVSFIPFSVASVLGMDEQRRAGRASVQPPVPDWLQSADPHYVIPLPDGSFITNGSPGAKYFDLDGAPHFSVNNTAARLNVWQRYSAGGELLGETPLYEPYDWLALTAPRRLPLTASMRRSGYDVRFVDGFLLVFDHQLGVEAASGSGVMVTPDDAPKLVAAYDWDGTALDISRPLTREGGWCIPLLGVME